MMVAPTMPMAMNSAPASATIAPFGTRLS